MQAVNDEIETIHLYVVKEEAKKPPVFLPLFAALLSLAAIVGVTVYSAYNPSYVHETLTIPAQFLPLQTFTATQQIIPTGIKTYSATRANGIIALYNGSIAVQQLPAGMIIAGKDGVDVVTDQIVVIPAGNPPTYGSATVFAHAVLPGIKGNIAAHDIDQVYGTSLYIRNLHTFTGGQDTYST